MKWNPEGRFHESGFIFILLFGVLCGTVIANCLYQFDMTLIQPFILDQYYSDAVFTYSYKKLALHIIPERIIQAFILAIFSLIFSGMGIFYVLFYCVSLTWGFLASLEVMRFGLHGLLFAGICILPHGVIYCSILYFICHLDMNAKKKRLWVVGILFLLALCAEIILEPKLLRWVGSISNGG